MRSRLKAVFQEQFRLAHTWTVRLQCLSAGMAYVKLATGSAVGAAHLDAREGNLPAQVLLPAGVLCHILAEDRVLRQPVIVSHNVAQIHASCRAGAGEGREKELRSRCDKDGNWLVSQCSVLRLSSAELDCRGECRKCWQRSPGTSQAWPCVLNSRLLLAAGQWCSSALTW